MPSLPDKRLANGFLRKDLLCADPFFFSYGKVLFPPKTLAAGVKGVASERYSLPLST